MVLFILTSTIFSSLLRSPYPSTPKRGAGIPPGSPGTPAHVLRARNTELKQKLEEQNEWLQEWQAELSELRDFQKVELQLLEESFQLKVADGPIDNTKVRDFEFSLWEILDLYLLHLLCCLLIIFVFIVVVLFI